MGTRIPTSDGYPTPTPERRAAIHISMGCQRDLWFLGFAWLWFWALLDGSAWFRPGPARRSRLRFSGALGCSRRARSVSGRTAWDAPLTGEAPALTVESGVGFALVLGALSGGVLSCYSVCVGCCGYCGCVGVVVVGVLLCWVGSVLRVW